MSLVFYRINSAINFTFEWLDKGRIISQLLKFGGELNLDYLDTYYEVTFRWQEHMKEEIYQTITTCDEKTQVFMFEELIPYLSDWRIASVPEDHIKYIVDQYNREEEIRFNNEVIEKDKKHRQGVDYTKPHLSEYEIERKFGLPMLAIGLMNSGKHIVINNYFYEFRDTPKFIDDRLLSKYYDYLDTIQSSFREKVGFFTKLYQEGKYVPKDRITIEKNILALDERDTPKPLSTSTVNEKIKMNLTSAQLLYMFKALKDIGILTNINLTELYKVIANSFQLLSKKEGEEISIKKLANTWSAFDTKTAQFWVDTFVDLRNAAKKDNPNNIK